LVPQDIHDLDVRDGFNTRANTRDNAARRSSLILHKPSWPSELPAVADGMD
jgi:hypothetical protein